MNNVLADNIGTQSIQNHIAGYERCTDIEIWYSLYFQDLCKYSLKYVSIMEIAEEVVSEVFYKMWKNRDTISFNYSVKAYLFSAVRNQSIDYLRKSQNQRLFSSHLYLDIASPHVTPEDEYTFYELNNRINFAIESLPPRCKKIFRLSRDKGFKYKEIAQMLNISVKTVETQMRKALICLRSQLIYSRNIQ
ncbi:RNA polymerase sigma-70 factor [Fulvivirgaceae bacterium BMA12]|uniref:RNA polymerase sigma-70 factor n=1 Tax=Agaribacillus aureus TaxID=3051825 RepID=A0ABT8LH79_9BACT|nr:RNA polymerase sigma-70 factor [Fulvivirgaceae bacterium BMA12]